MSSPEPQVVSDRPAVTADLTARPGLDDVMLARLVHSFYDRVRVDLMLGLVFADRFTDWGPRLAKIVESWPSVALMTGCHHDQPRHQHLPPPAEDAQFDRWIDLLRQTADEVCPPSAAIWFVELAERIAGMIHKNILDARNALGRTGLPPKR